MEKTMTDKYERYYVTAQSYWPIVGSIGLGAFVIGAGALIQGKPHGVYVFGLSIAIILCMMFGWFRHIILESMNGLYSAQMDRSFRWGMIWFIFSEVMFFATFFGVLYYVRLLSIPWLAGLGDKASTGMLWEGFKATWPLLENPDPTKFQGPEAVISWKGLPLLNTILLVTSSITITFAHHKLIDNNRSKLILWLFLTIILGATFLYFQAKEYHEAYTELGLTLDSGIYGSTFFMLTGFHGLHVTLGTIMLVIILLRCFKGHFSPKNHFGFEAVAWYWHFVDVVWVMLFFLVYIL